MHFTFYSPIPIILLIILNVVGLPFYHLIFPFWMIADCSRSNSLGRKGKVIWICVIFLFWSVGSAIYGFFKAESILIKGLSVFFLVLCFSFIMLCRTLDEHRDGEAALSINRLDYLDVSELSPMQIDHLKIAMTEVKSEAVGSKSWVLFRRKMIASDLFGLFDVRAHDNKIDKQEFEEWMQKYHDREKLNRSELLRFVNNLREEQNRIDRRNHYKRQ